VAYVALLLAIGYGPSVWWVWYVQRRWGGGRWAAVGWRFQWGDLWRGPVAYLIAIGTQIAVGMIVLTTRIPTEGNVDDVSGGGVDRTYVVCVVIAAVIAAPIVEELVFRGVVLRGFLSRVGPVVAIGAQGVLFGIAHVDPVRGSGNIGLAIILSGVGVAFGAVSWFVRRIGPTVIAHAIFNGVVMIIVLTGVIERLQEYEREAAWLLRLV
jgi:membrane protease YdiL (CAAX protease family)